MSAATEAAVYLEAAEITDQSGRSSCLAVCEAAGHDWLGRNYLQCAPASRYAEAFRPLGARGNWWDGEPAFTPFQEIRVLALLLMAAMVEAGDA